MKYALVSDIHSNIHAMDACLDHAATLGIANFMVLGDLVGYGAFPAQVVTRCQAIQNKGGVVVRGNHDEAVANASSTTNASSTNLGYQTTQWTSQQLSPEQRQWLGSLPLTQQEGAMFLVHASAHTPERWLYVDNARSAEQSLDAACTHSDVRYVFGGHVHEQVLYYRGTGRQLMPFKPTANVPITTAKHRQWLATIGSVGQPRDGNPRAMYAVFDALACQLTFYRVAYDHAAAARAIRAAGLPEFFANRLALGR